MNFLFTVHGLMYATDHRRACMIMDDDWIASLERRFPYKFCDKYSYTGRSEEGIRQCEYNVVEDLLGLCCALVSIMHVLVGSTRSAIVL